MPLHTKQHCKSLLVLIVMVISLPSNTHNTLLSSTEEERKILIAQSERAHRRRSELHPKQEDLVGLVKNAKSRGRRIVMVSLGTVVTSDRAAFGWQGTGGGERYVL